MSKSNPGQQNVRYEVITQADSNGDLIIPVPLSVLKKLGWKEGDDVELGVDENGRIFIKKVYK
jgi:bifunctional DNA-binding transcriptional regulator/antitoxin component of YhaV-PrlF toxin-antitoxin module